MRAKSKLRYAVVFLVFLIVLMVIAVAKYKKTQDERNQVREENYKVIGITGGLGNQMFQYALSLALANESNCNVYYDLSFYEEENQLNSPTVEEMLNNPELSKFNAKRKFSLKNFNINYQTADKEKIERCTSKIDGNVIKEVGIQNFNNGKHEYILDYFETLELFDYEKYRDTFTREFTIKVDMDEKNKEMLKNIKDTDSIAVHIRRTDHGGLGFTSLKYYDKAVNYMVSKVESPHFFVFSDDLNWVKENFKLDYPHTVVDINSDSTNYFDFELMKNCKHHIIANSTFSWWAAWLNPNKEKIVIAPTPWFQWSERNEMMPKDWVRIKDD